eukprot:sb/3470647/
MEEDGLGTVKSEAIDDYANIPSPPMEGGSSSWVGSAPQVEKRIRDELVCLGILGASDEESEDEILSELLEKQAELRKLAEYNQTQLGILTDTATECLVLYRSVGIASTTGDLSKVSPHGGQEGVLALSAVALEVIHGDIPHHTSTKTLLLDVVHLELDGLDIIISHPLVALVGIGSNDTVGGLHLGPSLVLQVQTNLEEG